MQGSAGRLATLLLAIGAVVLSLVGAGLLTSAPAVAAGTLPPSNPSTNIPPDSSDWLTAIDGARSQEGVGTMDISESAFDALPLDQQVFTAVNNERVDRGLPPIEYLTSQLDSYAQNGANAGGDPSFPTTLTGGAPITYGGSIWAGGLTSVLEADYYWMYDDGYSGSSTSNAACSASTPSGCWGHRDIILHGFANCPGGAPILSMGAAFSSGGYSGGSIAAIFVSSCAPPTDITDSWGQLAGSVAVRLAHGSRRADPQRHRVLGDRVQRHGRRLRIGPELRVPQRSAQLAHRGHGLDTRRQGLLAGGFGRWRLQLR